MTRIFENTRVRRILSMFLAVITVIGLIRWSPFTTSAADPDGRTADNASFNSWKSLFGADNLSTEFAGGVWTDKSVFTYDRYNEDTSLPFKDAGVKMTDTGDNFLVALSAIASNMQIEGYSNVPTDTMLVLDVSGSMNNESNRLADEMVEAANDAVAELLATNKYNRVGVVLYSGTSASSTNSDASVVLLPLGRYTTGTDGEYISYSSGGWSSDERVSLDGDVRIEGTTNRPSSTGKDVVGATYIQKGVILAKDQFAAMSGDTTVSDSVLGTVTRTPVIVLMSDGAPTLATTAYTAPGQYQMGNGQASSTSSALGFVTQLSASYAKSEVEKVYGTDCLFYTLGIGISSLDYGSDVARSVLDPENSSTNIDRYWSNWQSAAVGGRVSVGSGRSVTKIDGLEQEYVDRYFAVENTSNMSADLLAAFADIVKTIQLQSVYHPTLVEGDNYHHDGYISFVDKIGEYMTVTDIKGLLIGGRLYSGATLAANFAEGGGGGLLGTYDNPTALGDNMVRAVMERLGLDTAEEARTVIGLAYDHGQLSYTDENNFSNYIGWYANAQGEFLGFWYDGITTMPDPDSVTDPTLKPAFIIRSYGFLGEADASHGVAESDMMYATIQVRESIESGETTVAFAVPASLIPLVTYNVTLGENDELTALSVSGAENPIRLVYEVALREDINSLTVHELVDDGYAYRNADGTYSFYTNKWQSSDVSYGTSNTYSYFEPSRANERYYYTEDSLVYADTAGTVFSGTLDVGGEYYRAFTVYRKDGDVLSSAPVYERISATSLAKAVANGDGTYYIPAGTVHTYIDHYDMEKADQTITETYKYENKPFVDAQYSYITGAVLGNNGRLVLEPETGIRLTKTINGGDADANAAAVFTFTLESVAAGTYDTVRIASDGTETKASVTASDGKITVTLKDGEALYVLGLAPGSYTVTEADSSAYKAVTAAGAAGNSATVTVVDRGMTDAAFVNAPKGNGKLLITKEIAHDLGAGYDIPVNENTLFTIDVKLEGLNVANRIFAAKHSGNADITSITTDADGAFTIQLRHGDTFELSEVTEGIVATVTERTPASGFSAAYTDDSGASLTDGIVTVEAGRNHYVLVTNTYDAEKVYPVNITLKGDKSYDAVWDSEVFTVELQRYVSGAYTTIATADMNKDARSFDFTQALSAIDFDTPGTYYFKVVEKNAGQTIAGVTYDITEHTFAVVVSDTDMDGKLEISSVYSTHTNREFEKNADGDFEIDITFNNTYRAEGTSAYIDIQKELTDTSLGTLVTRAGFRFGLYTDEACTTPALDASGNAVVSDLTGIAGTTRILLTYGSADVGQTYTYYLREIVPADANGKITYSNAVYTVTVEVRDNGDGSSTAVATVVGDPDNVAEFTNTYDPDDATLDLKVYKELEGRDLNENEFTFYVKDGDTVIATGKNGADGNVIFDKPITFSEVGKYSYTVTEEKGSLGGVSYDDRTFYLDITVSDIGGKLKADMIIVNSTLTTVTFKNGYEAKETSIVLGGVKTLEGRTLINNEFEFILTEVDSDGNVIEDGVSLSAFNFTGGAYAFAPIEYTKADEYYYTVTEKNAGQVINGIAYDDTAYRIKVVVTDDGEGMLFASVVDGEGNAVADTSYDFLNKYTAASTAATIPGTKVLEGKTLGPNDFSFFLWEADGDFTQVGTEPIDTAENGEGSVVNSFAFDEITFDKAGVYRYLVSEQYAGQTINGVTYDYTVYRVEIHIIDNGRGQLEATTYILDEEGAPVDSGIVFTNKYAITGTGEVTLSGTKVLSGAENRGMEADEFRFELYATGADYVIAEGAEPIDTAWNALGGSFAFDTITYGAGDLGDHYYVITEADTGLGGVDYDGASFRVRVSVTDDEAGGVSVVREVTPVDTDETDIVFNNSYSTGNAEITIEGSKTLDGKTIADGMFTFELWASNENGDKLGTEPIDTAENVGNGFAFDQLSYSTVGTSYYLVAEQNGGQTIDGITYDGTVFKVVVDVTDNKAGALVADVKYYEGDTETALAFENSYAVTGTGEVTLSGTKVLSGAENRGMEANEFRFELYATGADYVIAEGAEPIDTAWNALGGSFSFDTIIYGAGDLGDHYYVIVEADTGLGGVDYDGASFRVKVSVTDDEAGGVSVVKEVTPVDTDETDIVFNNSYSTDNAEVTIEGSKTLEGRDLSEGEFTFVLTPVDENGKPIEGAEVLTATNAESGSFSFGLSFDKVDVYYFTLTEQKGDLERVTYDESVYFIKVSVTDNKAGALEASVETTLDREAVEGGITFVNVYTPKPDDRNFDVVVSKTVKNVGKYSRDPSGFVFTLTCLETGDVLESTTDKDGHAIFVLTYTEDDIGKTYYYELGEMYGGRTIEGVTYSNLVYEIAITIGLSEDNELISEVKINSEDADDLTVPFENIYDSEWNTIPPADVVNPPEQTIPGNANQNAPQTSDESRWGMWFGFLSLAAAGMVGTVLFGRKKKHDR